MNARLAIIIAAVAGGAAAAPLSSLVIAQDPAPGGRRIAIGFDSIGGDGHIAQRNSAYGANIAPRVTWHSVKGAEGFALVLEDPDAGGAAPFVHWLTWNIPADVTALAEGARPAGPEGRNGRGGVGYWGPHPPSGTHHYYMEVFALDAPLALKAGADRAALVQAMRGHVLASGEAVGLYSAP